MQDGKLLAEITELTSTYPCHCTSQHQRRPRQGFIESFTELICNVRVPKDCIKPKDPAFIGLRLEKEVETDSCSILVLCLRPQMWVPYEAPSCESKVEGEPSPPPVPKGPERRNHAAAHPKIHQKCDTFANQNHLLCRRSMNSIRGSLCNIAGPVRNIWQERQSSCG